MTINRSQGQSIDYILLDLRKDSFTHGQGYVAFSRIRRFDRITLIVNEGDTIDSSFAGTEQPVPIIRNIIYPQLILNPPV